MLYFLPLSHTAQILEDTIRSVWPFKGKDYYYSYNFGIP